MQSQTVRRAHASKRLSGRTSSCSSGSLFNLGAEGQLQASKEEGELTKLFFVRCYSLSCFGLGFTHNHVWKTDLTQTPLLQKIMTKRTFLAFWQLSQWERKSNSRLGFWKCRNIRTHFLYPNLPLIGHQMQKPTEKMLTDVPREIASVLFISVSVKADNAGDSTTN